MDFSPKLIRQFVTCAVAYITVVVLMLLFMATMTCMLYLSIQQ